MQETPPLICEAPKHCACVCHKLGYISHGNCCDESTEFF